MAVMVCALIGMPGAVQAVFAGEGDPGEDQAAEYDLWVGGVQVTDVNTDNILGEAGQNGGPTAKYDPQTRTLTLNDPQNLTGTHDNSLIYSEDDLTIEGEAKIKNKEIKNGINVLNHGLTLRDAELYIETQYTGINVLGDLIIDQSEITSKVDGSSGGGGLRIGFAIYASNSVTVTGDSTVSATATGGRAFSADEGDLFISNSTVTANSAEWDNYGSLESSHGNVTITSGSKVDATGGKYGIYSSKDVTIEDGSNVDATGSNCGILARNLTIADGTASISAESTNDDSVSLKALYGTLSIGSEQLVFEEPAEGARVYVDKTQNQSIIADENNNKVKKVVIKAGCRMKYDTNGGTPQIEDQIVQPGEEIPQPEATKKTGAVVWTLNGWYKDKELTDPLEKGEKASKHLILYAKWTTNLKLYVQGQSFNGTVTATVDGMRKSPAREINIPNVCEGEKVVIEAFRSDGYQFVKWIRKAGDETKDLDWGARHAFEFDGAEYFAVFETKTKPEVIFKPSGGSWDGSTKPMVIAVEQGKKVTKPEDPVKDGLKLMPEAWYTDQECTKPFDFDTAIREDITLYAGWEAPIRVDVYTRGAESSDKYSAGGSYGLVYGDREPKECDEASFCAPREGTQVKLTAAAEEGYAFEKWVRHDYCGQDADGSIDDVDTLQTVSTDPEYMFTADASARYTAVFVKTHEVSFTVDGERIDKVTVNSGSQVAKPEDPKKPGYGFDGWTLNGEAYDFDSPVTRDIELAATWHQHTWGEANYTWADDDSTCTASRTCSACEETETETVNAAFEETKRPTTKNTGLMTCTAVFENQAFETQKKEKEIPVLSKKQALEPGASIEAADEVITQLAGEADPAGAVYGKLKLRSTKQKKTSETIVWTKVKGASSYVLYGSRCGKADKMQRLGSYTGSNRNLTRLAGKKLKKGTYYKYIIVAIDSSDRVVSTSKVIHVATKGGKVTNPKKVTVKKGKKAIKKVTVKKGKTVKVKSSVTKAAKKLKLKTHRAIRYESSNTGIAAVSAKGVIKGVRKGTCTVFAYAQNGVTKSIKVTVK